jgi:hypothetical protein
MDDIDCVITANEKTVESIPDGHPALAMHLHNLVNALRGGFERAGLMEDLNRAIATNEQSVESTPDN